MLEFTYRFIVLAIPVIALVTLLFNFIKWQNLLTITVDETEILKSTGLKSTSILARLVGQIKYLSIFLALFFLLLWFLLSFWVSFIFLIGAACLLLINDILIKLVGRAINKAALTLASENSEDAWQIAFLSSAIVVVFVVSIVQLTLGTLFVLFGNPHDWTYLVAFAAGGAWTALFIFGNRIAENQRVNYSQSREAGSSYSASSIKADLECIASDTADLGVGIYTTMVAAVIACMVIAASVSTETLQELTYYLSNSPLHNASAYNLWLMIAPMLFIMLSSLTAVVTSGSINFFKNYTPTKMITLVVFFSTIVFLILNLIVFATLPLRLNLWLCALFAVVAALVGAVLANAYWRLTTNEKSELPDNYHSRFFGKVVNFSVKKTSASLIVVLLLLCLANWSAGIFGVAIAAVVFISMANLLMIPVAYERILDGAMKLGNLLLTDKELQERCKEVDSNLPCQTLAYGKSFLMVAAGVVSLSLLLAYTTVLKNSNYVIDLSLSNPMVLIGCIIGVVVPILGLSSKWNYVYTSALLVILVTLCSAFIFGAETLAGVMLGLTLVALAVALLLNNTGIAESFAASSSNEIERPAISSYQVAIFAEGVSRDLGILIKTAALLALLISPQLL